MKYVIDIDGVVAITDGSNYKDSRPNIDVINSVNALFNAGNEIVFFTARGMRRFSPKECDRKFRRLTEDWLLDNNVKYHELHFGKPSADFYVDDKNLSVSELLKSPNDLGDAIDFSNRKFSLDTTIRFWRNERGRKIIFTNGCFDCFHDGHQHLINFMKERYKNSFFVVGLNSDKSASQLKGINRPKDDIRTRVLNVSRAFGSTDNLIVVFDELTPLTLTKRIFPDVIIKGSDYDDKEVVGADFADAVDFCPVLTDSSGKKISTTDILNAK